MGSGAAQSRARSVVKATGAFCQAFDIEVSDLGQDSNGCLDVLAEFCLSVSRVVTHVLGCNLNTFCLFVGSMEEETK